MDTQEALRQLEQFRLQVYDSFDYRADALMDLIDAIASNTAARSVVELSLNPQFRREYSSVYDAIDQFFQGVFSISWGNGVWGRLSSLPKRQTGKSAPQH